ncbi:hypothetical protein C8Q80DRAFT_348017 [Daedaleopsis nitida]|nr:hypothetical protein C8Q80DRAFT_348017 [Daedaleopsis nitida]
MVKPLRFIRCRVSSTLCLILAACSSARSVNRTIDNANGDSVTGVMPEYVPTTGWAEGDLCPGCKAQPDHTKAHDGTWSDATHHPADSDPRIVRLQFSGTAVYVYNIMANTIPYVDTLANLTFNLDGNVVATYVHQPTSSTDYDYNVNVFRVENLEDTDHVLEMQSVGDTKPSLILFDYAIYSITELDPPPPPPPSSSPPTSSHASTTSDITSTSHTTTISSSPSPATSAIPTDVTKPSSSSSDIPQGTSAQSQLPSSADQSTSPILVSVSSTPTTTGSTLKGDGSQRRSSVPLGLIIGCAIGGICLLIAIALIAWSLRRRRTRSPTSTADRAGTSLRPLLQVVRGIGTRGRVPRGDEHSAASETGQRPSQPIFVRPTSAPPASDDWPAPASSSRCPPSSLTTLVAASATRLDLDAKLEVELVDSARNSEPESEVVADGAPLPAVPPTDAYAIAPSQRELAPRIPPVRRSLASGSDRQTSYYYDDSRTEYTYVTQSDGSVSRMRGELAVLREEVRRLRHDQEMLHLYQWDEAPPQYQ